MRTHATKAEIIAELLYKIVKDDVSAVMSEFKGRKESQGFEWNEVPHFPYIASLTGLKRNEYFPPPPHLHQHSAGLFPQQYAHADPG